MWTVKQVEDEQQVLALAKECNISESLARILWLRDIKTKEEIIKFLNPKLTDLYPNLALPDIEPAIRRIQQAIVNKEKILIWGHEDLDGITATIILYETIKAIQGFPYFYIPPKGKDKHGLSEKKVAEFAQQGIKLIITVDCGITNIEEVVQINNLGIDVIVTDHHEVLDSLPKAVANIDPKRKDATYPFSYLAGVGIALKLALALVEVHLGINIQQFFAIKPDFLGFTALGTISDRVPLISENRIFAKFGLQQLAQMQNPAVNAIFATANFDREHISTERFFAEILPIFASANGNTACDYFLFKNYDECLIWAKELYEQSQIWQKEARQNLELAEQIVDLAPGILFVRDERLSLRVLGHIASKLKDRFQVPALIMGLKNDDWVGECRGINGVDLIELLKAHKSYFTAFGGHKKACGFTVPKQNVDAFIKSAKKYAKEHFVGNIIKENKLIPDGYLSIKELTEEYKKLGPFGEGNPAPILIAQNTALTKHNSKYIFLERPDLEVKVATDQQLLDRVFVDILYTFDENLTVTILRIDYLENS